MKVTPEHRVLIADAIAESGLDREDIRARYRARDIPRADAVQDIDKRFRWDLFHAVVVGSGALRALVWGDHPYNDAHLDTALRSIVAPL